MFGAHERPGSTQRKRYSIDAKHKDSKQFAPLPKEWTMKEPVIIEESEDDQMSLPSSKDSPLYVSIPSHDSRDSDYSVDEIKSSPLKSTPITTSALSRQSSRASDDNNVDLTRFSVASYLYSEIFGIGEPGHLEPDAVSNIHNFLHVPYKLETLIEFGFVICLDSFLFVLTFLPLRVFFSLLALFGDCLMSTKNLMSGNKIFQNFHRTHAYDLMRGLLLVLGCWGLHFLNMSRVYHFIRGQTMIKLYAITGMFEIFDKLLCTFGQDAFDSLYWQTCVQPDVPRIGGAFLVVSGYVLAHSCVYFIHVATLTVAFNSDDQALITVLILNNFSEIKGFVFKKFDKQQLFQLACADITERFILVLFFTAVGIVAFAQAGSAWREVVPTAAYVIGMMLSGEAIADSVKHG
jgi:hypothetical protein